MKNNLIKQKTFDFAISMIKLSRLLKQKQDYVIANQLLKSGTSIGANVEEALGGASKRDFIAKLIIANKEARETCYWLKLIQAEDPTQNPDVQIKEANDILNIISKIIITSKKNLND